MGKPIRILYLQQLLILPGCTGINRSYELAKEWVSQGHEVTIVCSNAAFPKNHTYYSSKKYPVLFQYEGINIYVLDIAYSHFMPFWRRLIAFIYFFFKALFLCRKLTGFDILIAYSAPLSVGELGRRLARFYKIPWVFEIADVWPDVPIDMGVIKQPSLIKWLYKRTKHMYDEASIITPFSEGMKNQIMLHQVSSDKIHVLHNGVNIRAFPYHKRAFKVKDTINIIYAGTIGLANGLEQLVEAASLIQTWGRKDITFTMLGDGNQRNLIQQLLSEKKLDNFQFLGAVPQNQVETILQQADIGIISFAPYPTLETNGATKFFDYLANGLPIVTNYEGWQANYMETYQCGLYSKQGDLNAFAKSILRLADDPHMREIFSTNGRKLAEVHFDRQKLARKKLALMKACINKNHSR